MGVASMVHTLPMTAFVFLTAVAVYGVLVLVATARFTGRLLVALLLVAFLPAVLLMFLLPVGSWVGSLGLPMLSGVTFAAAIRGLKGIDKPLRGATAA